MSTTSAQTVRAPAEPPPPRRRSRVVWIVLILCAALGGAWWWVERRPKSAEPATAGRSTLSNAAEHGRLPVAVVHPQAGGLPRTTTQPGTVHAFEWANLYAKASGFLINQVVDIGSQVKNGQLLAEIYEPERQQAVRQATAAREQAEAVVEQSRAAITEAAAEAEAASAEVELRQAEIAQYTATRVYREKEFRRFTELAERRSVDERVADEKQKDFEAAQASEHVAQAAVRAAKGRLAKAIAAETRSKADLVAAQANVRVATAALGRAQILVEYTKIVSPYDGVVTLRSFHRGDFIRSAAEGNTTPVLAVARTDLMRIVVYVPDMDVPNVRQGADAVLRIDALDGESFSGKVARFAAAEDPLNRTMRTEIDLPNPHDRLREGMYGTVTIQLRPPARELLNIPSSALIEAAHQGQGTVYVVRDGRAHQMTVQVGKDDGLRVEVRSGLKPDDQVVVAYSGSMEDGEPVVTTTPSH